MVAFYNKKKRNLIFLFAALVFMVFSARTAFAETIKSKVTIVRAMRTQNFKDRRTGRDIVQFSGDVFLTVEKGATRIEICADTVNYDRERSMIYASGSVIMEENISDATSRRLEGSSLLLNTSSLEGIFDEFKFNQKQKSQLSPDGETELVISAELFARNDSGTAVFKNGTITFCDEPDPHWQIKASRLWLLPGNEFAFLNGLLYVGRIPVLYLPFFYYPKDEMIFNPSFGYRPRVGYYTQTTTYIIGRKPLPKPGDGSDSGYSFTQVDQLYEQTRQGLFLRNSDTPVEEKGESRDFVKILADLYSNLGGMAGVQGEFHPEDSFVQTIDFAALGAKTRNLYFLQDNALYSPKNLNGASEWNSSSIFGVKLPVRYFTDFGISGKNDALSIALRLPLYSDPFFKADFFNRSENMDWVGYFTKQGISTESENETYQDAVLNSFMWRLSGNFAPNMEDYAPYFKFAINNFESYVDWQAKTNQAVENVVDPNRQFYYPDEIVPLNADISVNGTIIDYIEENYAQKQIERLFVEEYFKRQDELAEKGENYAESLKLEKPSDFIISGDYENFLNTAKGDFPFPVLGTPRLPVKEIGGFAYTLKYSLNPQLRSLYKYSPQAWPNPSVSAWNDFMNNFFSVSGTNSLDSVLKWRNGFFELDNSIVFDGVYQKHPSVNAKYYNSGEEASQVALSDIKARKAEIKSVNSVILRPFVLTDYFAETSISYNNSIRLLRRQTAEDGSDIAAFSLLGPKWDEKTFEEHNVTLDFVAKTEDIKEEIKIKSALPPLLPKHEVEATFNMPHFETKTETGVAVHSKTDNSWYVLPVINQVTVAGFEDKLRLTQTVKYIAQGQYYDYFNAGLSFGGLSLEFSEIYTSGYDYDPVTGWKSNGEVRFRPYQGVVRFDLPKKTYYFWKDRIVVSPTLNTSVVVDFLKPTASYFTFSPGLDFTVNEFLHLTFSSDHRNDVIFRYVQDGLGKSGWLPGETNWFVDLAKSYNFANLADRQASGFKVNSFKMQLTHDLHDWNVNSKLEISPRMVYENGYSHLDYTPSFSFSAVWKPLPAAKAEIVDEYGTVQLNP